ncbi:Lactoylglutathione lyase [Cladophialophora chaetospira]|uniref:lactoylglutathione lyase n=1 Tax=Cladophialophora chaetospira TaxID=386627 RepID=A0AA38X9I4_9EURO|nr:Lactoylglutathione lyase [Cladophialophora chaetospira]
MVSIDKSQWRFRSTSLRIKDPKRSLEFYKFLGMSVLKKTSMPFLNLDSYSLCYRPQGPRPKEGILELLHNDGSENNASFAVANGNDEPDLGYGHICISVDSLPAACERLEKRGCRFQKKLREGPNSHMAFVLDPDGYWIELVSNQPLAHIKDPEKTDTDSYLLNHTMLRVSDPQRTRAFYEEILGMRLLWSLDLENIESRFEFYGFCEVDDARKYGGDVARGENPVFHRQGVLELKYHHRDRRNGVVYYNGNGNSKPRGFAWICIAIDDLVAACEYLDRKGVVWIKRLSDGPGNTYAIMTDPDGYWIKMIDNQAD